MVLGVIAADVAFLDFRRGLPTAKRWAGVFVVSVLGFILSYRVVDVIFAGD